MPKTATKSPSKKTAPKPVLGTLPTQTQRRTAKKAAAPLLAKALGASSMSSATEDLLTNRAWQPGETSALQYILVADIYPAVDNPRADLGDLTGLAASIAAVGILEPILVQIRLEGGYSIVAGHRRHAAARIAGLELIPCIVRSFTEQARIEAMVIENLQRQDLSPFDEARGLTQLVNVGLTQRDIAERVGCSQSHVSKRLALAAMPAATERLFVAESMTIQQVEELAKVPDVDRVAVVDELVARAATAKDSLLPHWAIADTINTLKQKRKHNEAEKVGEASGLKRLDQRPYDSPGGTRVCKKTEATHWYLHEREAHILWARTQAAHNKANPTVGDDATSMSRWQIEQQAGDRIEEFIEGTLLPAVTADVAARAVFIASISAMARTRIEIAWLRVPTLTEEALKAVGDDDALFIAVALLGGLTNVYWRPDVLDLFVAHGYRTTGIGETFPEGFDPTPILIVEPVDESS